MFENAKLALKALKESVAEAQPEVLDGKTALEMMEIYAEAERVAAAGKALMARRGPRSPAWWRTPARLLEMAEDKRVGRATLRGPTRRTWFTSLWITPR